MQKLDRLVFEIIHGLTSNDPRLREESADRVPDVASGLSPDIAVTIARVLVLLRMTEDYVSCMESQLNALAALHEWHPLPLDVLDPLRYLPPATVQGSQGEYLDYLFHDEANHGK